MWRRLRRAGGRVATLRQAVPTNDRPITVCLCNSRRTREPLFNAKRRNDLCFNYALAQFTQRSRSHSSSSFASFALYCASSAVSFSSIARLCTSNCSRKALSHSSNMNLSSASSLTAVLVTKVFTSWLQVWFCGTCNQFANRGHIRQNPKDERIRAIRSANPTNGPS